MLQKYIRGNISIARFCDDLIGYDWITDKLILLVGYYNNFISLIFEV